MISPQCDCVPLSLSTSALLSFLFFLIHLHFVLQLFTGSAPLSLLQSTEGTFQFYHAPAPIARDPSTACYANDPEEAAVALERLRYAAKAAKGEVLRGPAWRARPAACYQTEMAYHDHVTALRAWGRPLPHLPAPGVPQLMERRLLLLAAETLKEEWAALRAARYPSATVDLDVFLQTVALREQQQAAGTRVCVVGQCRLPTVHSVPVPVTEKPRDAVVAYLHDRDNCDSIGTQWLAALTVRRASPFVHVSTACAADAVAAALAAVWPAPGPWEHDSR